MELYNLANIYADRFIPVFIRIAVMFSFIPFISGKTVPMIVKVGFILALTLLALPFAEIKTDDMLVAVFEAFFVGMAMGLLIKIVMSAVEMAAQWIALQMGLGMAQIFNPQFGESMGTLTIFYMLMTMCFFFMLNLHHIMIEAIIKSFAITKVQFNSIFESVIKFSSIMFVLALKIAGPVLVVVLVVNIAIGFLSKAMPQANIFFVSFPLLLIVGFIFIMVSVSLMFVVTSRAFVNVKDAFSVFVR